MIRVAHPGSGSRIQILDPDPHHWILLSLTLEAIFLEELRVTVSFRSSAAFTS